MSDAADKPAVVDGALVESPKRVIGKPFPKGVSGNPGGRPKRELEAVRKAARAVGTEAIKTLVDLMRNGSDKVRYLAAEALLARGFGRPPVTVEAGDVRPGAVGLIILPPTDDDGR